MTKHQSELLPAGLTGWELGDPHVHKDAVDRKKCLISREVPASPTTHCSQQSCACPSSHVGCGPRGYGVEAARTRQFLHQQLRAALASLISPKHPPPDSSKWKAPTYKLIKILTMNEKEKRKTPLIKISKDVSGSSLQTLSCCTNPFRRPDTTKQYKSHRCYD